MKEDVAELGRVKTQALVLLVLAFLAGAFAGGAIERVGARQWRGWPGARPGARPGGGRGGSAFGGGARGGRGERGGLPPAFDAIGLSATQRTNIEEIVKRRLPRVDSLMRQSRAMINAASDSTRKEIDDVLSADQRRKLDSLRPRGRGFGGAGGLRGPNRGGGPAPAAAAPPGKP